MHAEVSWCLLFSNASAKQKRSVCVHICTHDKESQLPWLLWLSGFKSWPVNQEIAGFIPSQGTCLGCRPGPQFGVCERQLIDVSLPLFLPLSPSVWKLINIMFLKFFKRFTNLCKFWHLRIYTSALTVLSETVLVIASFDKKAIPWISY